MWIGCECFTRLFALLYACKIELGNVQSLGNGRYLNIGELLKLYVILKVEFPVLC
jgi:hypothetical protein